MDRRDFIQALSAVAVVGGVAPREGSEASVELNIQWGSRSLVITGFEHRDAVLTLWTDSDPGPMGAEGTLSLYITDVEEGAPYRIEATATLRSVDDGSVEFDIGELQFISVPIPLGGHNPDECIPVSNGGGESDG